MENGKMVNWQNDKLVKQKILIIKWEKVNGDR